MPKINIANIQSALGKVKDAAAPLQNKGHTENVPVDYIRLADRNVFNETDTDQSIKELADNIDACGLEHPIAVNKMAPDNYRVISGERRYRAITEYLHWKTIPCMVFENLSPEAEQVKLFMANLAVREYTASQKYRFYLEVKELLKKMKASGQYKGGMQKGIAEILSVTKRQVARYSAIEKLPIEIQTEILDGRITLNKALEISALKSVSDSTDSSEIEDTIPKKDDIGHHFEADDDSSTSEIEDTIPKKDDIGHHFEESAEVTPPINEDMVSSPKQPRLQDGSVLTYKNGQFIPNKIQILEEHEEYTVFKVFAVKL